MAIDRGLNSTVSSNPLGIDNDDYVATVVGPKGDKGDAGDTTAAYISMYNDTIAAKNTAVSSAATSASEASDASTSAANAATSETNASTSETNASTSETNAATSATNASTSETNAATSETNASASATSASTSSSTATTKATEAATSATNAAASEVAAELAETNAETAETNAAASATAAANSATAAATSETNIGNAETNSAASATAAAASETAAATSATNAAASESSVATNATNAATSESNAATSASTATTQASTATTKASEAATSATTATTKASEASTSATNAATSASAAATSATAAQTAETAAETAETNAETAQAAAETAETAAEAAETAATASQTAAAASQASATASANSATASANSASSSATDAQSSEDDAATSEVNASNSAAAASSSASAASTSATNAATSASSATTSASTATTKASEASTSATNAATSESNASTSASTATTKASEASTSATNAATSASTATTKASEASTSATTATTKASEASTSATTATTKASEASTSATNAATSATSAAASLASFTGQYVSQATAPSSPTTGDLWFNETADSMRVYDGTNWVNAGSSVNGVENSVEYTATANQTTFSVTYDVGYVEVYLNGIRLDRSDYTATNGTSVVLDVGAAVGDSVFIHAFGTFVLADHYTKVASDARFLNLSGGTLTGDLDFGDNDKAKFGAGDDLRIFHDGFHSYVYDQGVGNLRLRGSNAIELQSDSGENYLSANTDGAVTAYYDGSAKLTTTSTGVDVTGTVTATNLDVTASGYSNRPTLGHSQGNKVEITYNYNNYHSFQHTFKNLDGTTDTFQVGNTGNVSFFDDSGTVKGLWSAADEELKLTSGGGSLVVGGSGLADNWTQYRDNSNYGVAVGMDASGNSGSGSLLLHGGLSKSIDFTVNSGGGFGGGTPSMVLNQSGNLGIGTTSPSSELHVNSSGETEVIIDSGGTGFESKLTFTADNQRSQIRGGYASGGGGYLTFRTDSTGGSDLERMRIDSSGNVFVGKTSVNYNNIGVELLASGKGQFTRSGAELLTLNRKSNDGNLIDFRKDGTLVGNIGSAYGSEIYFGSPHSSVQKGIYINGNGLLPTSGANSVTTNAMDIGQPTGRWKDAYFSGTVSGSVDSRTLFTHNYVGPLSPTARVFTTRSDLTNAGLVNGGTYIFTAYLSSYLTGITSYYLHGCTRPWTFATGSSNNGSHIDIGEFVWQGHAYHPTVTISYRMEYNGSGSNQDFLVRCTGTSTSDFVANLEGKKLVIYVKRIA